MFWWQRKKKKQKQRWAAVLGSTSTLRDVSGRECFSGSCGSALSHKGERATYSCRLPKGWYEKYKEKMPFEHMAVKKE